MLHKLEVCAMDYEFWDNVQGLGSEIWRGVG